MAVHAVVAAVVLLAPEDTRRLLILTYGLTPAQWAWLPATTATLMHVGTLSLASDLLALWIFGSTLEDRLGHLRYLTFYLLAGYAGGVADCWAAPGSAAVVEAGSAVAGLIGGYMATFPRSRVLMLVPLWRSVDLVEVPVFLLPGFWLLGQAVASVTLWDFAADTRGSIWSIVAGGAFGAASIWVFRQPARQRVEWWGV